MPVSVQTPLLVGLVGVCFSRGRSLVGARVPFFLLFFFYFGYDGFPFKINQPRKECLSGIVRLCGGLSTVCLFATSKKNTSFLHGGLSPYLCGCVGCSSCFGKVDSSGQYALLFALEANL